MCVTILFIYEENNDINPLFYAVAKGVSELTPCSKVNIILTAVMSHHAGICQIYS